jgi:hypothetical protein
MSFVVVSILGGVSSIVVAHLYGVAVIGEFALRDRAGQRRLVTVFRPASAGGVGGAPTCAFPASKSVTNGPHQGRRSRESTRLSLPRAIKIRRSCRSAATSTGSVLGIEDVAERAWPL